MFKQIGRQLALAYTWPIFMSVAALVLLGSVSIWAYSPVEGSKQIRFMAVSVMVLLLVQMVNYQYLAKAAWGIYLASLLPVLYTVASKFHAVPLVHEVNGARAWIDFGPISFQPSEITKLAMILLLARTLRFGIPKPGLQAMVKPFAILAMTIVPILMQPDLGMTLTMIAPVFVMLYAAGQPVKPILKVVLAGVLVAPILWFGGTCHETGCQICPQVPVLRNMPQFVKHYQRSRVYAMVSDDPRLLKTTGYQQQRALEAFGSGGIMGKGLGNIPVGQHVPFPHTDMILALIGEQFGLVGVGATLLAYLVMYAGGLSIATVNRDPTGRLMAVGLVTLLAGQTVINMSVALRIMPVTGLTLPFVSYGGSSVLASFIVVGLWTNIAANRPMVMGWKSI